MEIRELIHGIHPHVLTDRGLVAAVEDLADRSPIPVDVRLTVPDRLLEAVETAVYFAVSEALTNVAKHSGATRVTVTGEAAHGRLAVAVEDDGHGGAVAGPDAGAVGGTGAPGRGRSPLGAGRGPATVQSARGPTVFRLEVPCPPADSRT